MIPDRHLAVWSVAVGMLPNPATIVTTSAIPSDVPVPVTASRFDPPASSLRIPDRYLSWDAWLIPGVISRERRPQLSPHFECVGENQ